jgi:hypothetical protein
MPTTLASDALVEANEETVNGRALISKGLKRNHGNGVSQRRSLVHIQYCLAGVCCKCRNGSIEWNGIVVLVKNACPPLSTICSNVLRKNRTYPMSFSLMHLDAVETLESNHLPPSLYW